MQIGKPKSPAHHRVSRRRGGDAEEVLPSSGGQFSSTMNPEVINYLILPKIMWTTPT